jgi:hypothetical protein
MAETSSFESETEALQEILRKLPDKDHRNILSQMMIMTNAKGQVSRIKIALQVKDALLASMESNGIEHNSDKAVQIIFHLACLKKTYRVLFGKCLFLAMSKLYKRSEMQKGGTNSSAKGGSPPQLRDVETQKECSDGGKSVGEKQNEADASDVSDMAPNNSGADASISVA